MTFPTLSPFKANRLRKDIKSPIKSTRFRNSKVTQAHEQDKLRNATVLRNGVAIDSSERATKNLQPSTKKPKLNLPPPLPLQNQSLPASAPNNVRKSSSLQPSSLVKTNNEALKLNQNHNPDTDNEEKHLGPTRNRPNVWKSKSFKALLRNNEEELVKDMEEEILEDSAGRNKYRDRDSDSRSPKKYKLDWQRGVTSPVRLSLSIRCHYCRNGGHEEAECLLKMKCLCGEEPEHSVEDCEGF